MRFGNNIYNKIILEGSDYMRRIILCFMFLLGMVIFAEKLTTDGKDNLDKLKEKWANGQYEFIDQKKQVVFRNLLW